MIKQYTWVLEKVLKDTHEFVEVWNTYNSRSHARKWKQWLENSQPEFKFFVKKYCPQQDVQYTISWDGSVL